MLDSEELGLRQGFWTHVQDCLVRFHKRSPNEAQALISEYLNRFPLTSEEPSVDFIYHVEPFRLACEITEDNLDIRDFADEYQQVLQADVHDSENKGLRRHKFEKSLTQKQQKRRIGPKTKAAKVAAKRPSTAKTKAAKPAAKRPSLDKAKAAKPAAKRPSLAKAKAAKPAAKRTIGAKAKVAKAAVKRPSPVKAKAANAAAKKPTETKGRAATKKLLKPSSTVSWTSSAVSETSDTKYGARKKRAAASETKTRTRKRTSR